MSVADFKADMGVPLLEVKKNPVTGKLFFVCGTETGAVSEKFELEGIAVPVISQVCSVETGNMFYLLHQKKDGGCSTLATY